MFCFGFLLFLLEHLVAFTIFYESWKVWWMDRQLHFSPSLISTKLRDLPALSILDHLFPPTKIKQNTHHNTLTDACLIKAKRQTILLHCMLPIFLQIPIQSFTLITHHSLFLPLNYHKKDHQKSISLYFTLKSQNIYLIM